MSEPGAGSDVVSMKLRAEQKGDRYVLNGSRCGSPTAATPTRWWSMPRPTRAGARGMTAFIVEKGFKGFSEGQHLDKLGMRGSNTYPLFFDDCEVPVENVLGGEGNGTNVLMSGLDYERAVLSGGPLGIMAGLHGRGAALHPRAQAVRPEHRRVPADAGQAGRHVLDLAGLRAYVYAVGKACDRGDHARTLRKDAAGAILYSAEKATWMAGEAIQALGGVGYTNEYPTAASGATPSSTRSAPAPAKSAAC
jgi:isovaleryl-CoA dehydrogenase